MMIRYAVFSILLVGFAATALASVLPEQPFAQTPHTKITYPKTAALMKATTARLNLEKCALEDCSDTPQ